MQCPKCGVENEEGRELCSACSWVLNSQFAEPAEDARTSGLAITALVLGILCMCTFMLTALPAIVFGIVALIKISKSKGELKGNGFAIAGIAIPAFLGIFVLPMLLAILMPALSKVKVQAQRLVCATNLKVLGSAMVVYSNDYDEMFPTAEKWNDLLMSEVDVPSKAFKCKGACEGESNYAMNENLAGKKYDVPDDTVVLFDAVPGWNQVGGSEMLEVDNHRSEGCNVMFADGRVEFIKTENLGSLNWGDEEAK